MRALQFEVGGRYAQFRKPETNNNPLTHDFITKTALIGLMGAVTGKDRLGEMRALFPILCADLRYGVSVRNPVKKESWGFTLRGASSYYSNYSKRTISDRAPKQMEFLRDPQFLITLVLPDESDERSRQMWEAFAAHLQNDEAYYTPVLGLHNCPANLKWSGFTEAQAADGDYRTQGFARRDHEPKWDGELSEMRVGYEKIPSFQDNDWWNDPERYVPVVYPSQNGFLRAHGPHFTLSNGQSWFLI